MLEQMLELTPKSGLINSQTIDLYAKETVALYTGPLMNNNFNQPTLNNFGNSFGQIQPSYGQNVVPYGNIGGFGGEMHDTFKIDRYDNIFGGHTTINIPGYDKKHLDW